MKSRRRALLMGLAAAAAPFVVTRGWAQGPAPFRFALTPVFLDNDAAVISALRAALAEGMGQDIELVQRRTYQEISGALLDGSVDAAWTCGYPYLQHKTELSLLGVPVWRGQPLYQSYLIVAQDDPATALSDLRGGAHAFSDPDSNSGFLVTASDLARDGQTPDQFFSRVIFTYGHRNVVRSVAGGLTRSGSVDGYVWEALSSAEPDLTARTKVIVRSEWLGFRPMVARADRMDVEGGAGPDGDIVAYSVLCPHKGFYMSYHAADKTLNCPGHFSRFDCEKGGQQIWGHATQNLPQFALRVDDKGDIYAEGADELIYGRLSNVLQG